MKVVVPAGIGDFSWVWSKLYYVKDEIEEFIIPDGWPHRTQPYVELCGAKASYDMWDYATIRDFQRHHGYTTWQEVRELNHGIVCIEANNHLEQGKPLQSWMRDLPTSFHYPLNITTDDYAVAAQLLARIPKPVVAISCASYRGSEAWKTWGREQWLDFLGRVQNSGFNPVIIGGFWDDLSFTVARALGLPDLVGKTSVAEGCAVLNLVDAYIGYSSGLNVIRTVLGKSAMAIWPEHQWALATSWVPPDMLNTQYAWSLWHGVDDVWPVAAKYLETCRSEYGKRSQEGRDESEAVEQETVGGVEAGEQNPA